MYIFFLFYIYTTYTYVPFAPLVGHFPWNNVKWIVVSKLTWIENKKFSKVSAKYFGGALKANLWFIAQFYPINFIL